VLDLPACLAEGMLHDVADSPAAAACAQPSLNELMSLGRPQVTALRQAVSEALRAGASPTRRDRDRAERVLVPQSDAELFVPAEVGDYTDFYASVHHATNVGAMFRPDQPLLPNYKWVPIGYHGRASSLVPGGAPVRRPSGQRKAPAESAPAFGPSRMLDYELELGAFVGPGTPLGGRLDAAEAEAHLFGLCLVNDWSARDLQAWEYQPLGPFLSKSFATTWRRGWSRSTRSNRSASPRPARAGRPGAAAVPARDGGPGARRVRRDGRGVAAHAGDARGRGAGGAAVARVVPRHVLDRRAAAHAPREQRLQPAPGDLLRAGRSRAVARVAGCLLEITRRGAEPVTLPAGRRAASSRTATS
jgi:fumarylacetoacetase